MMKSSSYFPFRPSFLLLMLISFQFLVVSSRQKTHLFVGQSLGYSDFLISPDKSFTCGFHCSADSSDCYFAVWFTNSADRTITWTPYRDKPITGGGPKLSLHRDGGMFLTNHEGIILWFPRNTTNINVQKAELLNTGNLVLTDPNGIILWQSFDSLTDTLLPLQLFTKNMRLISAMGKGTHSPGYFSFYFDENNLLRLLSDGPDKSSLYWPGLHNDLIVNGTENQNSSRAAVLDEMGRFIASDGTEFNATDMSLGIKRRLTMDYDGNLRLYSLNDLTGLWNVSWEALPQQCRIHGLCGRNGICVYTPKPECSCPPGYEMNDIFDWNKGCRPTFIQTCEHSEKIKFVEIPQTDFVGFDLDYLQGLSLESCKKLCLKNCTCEAFSYAQGSCYLKSDLFNGYKSPNIEKQMYLKLPRSVETPEPVTLEGSSAICFSFEGKNPEKGNFWRTWGYLYEFAFSIGVIELVFVTSAWWFLYRKHGLTKSMEEGYNQMSSQFRKFTYAELKKAAKNFEEELGRGGSGVVYKGVLEDKRVVAMKKLDDVFEEDMFWTEVSTIGRINHMNLVRILGFCSEGKHKLLVYEYLESGSLDKHLFFSSVSDNTKISAKVLSWRQRFNIAIGAAKGLAYLHHECLEWIIHCDVKPENILLDVNFKSKIADFGLAKLSQRGRSDAKFSRVRGTKGYMAPEWALSLPITAKVDVYSFGIVLLELVMGVRLSNWMMVDGEEEAELTRFVRTVRRQIESGEDIWVDDIGDSRLNGEFNRSQARNMVEIGISCLHEDKSKRPTMNIIVDALQACEDEQNFLQNKAKSRKPGMLEER